MQPLPPLPSRIAGLVDLARNLSWSWHREARALFREIDLPLWRLTRHNPIEMLRRLDPSRLTALAEDPGFCARYDWVMGWQHHVETTGDLWYAHTCPDGNGREIAYFCAEFGFHNSVPIYSGGLGVLAGDHCKAASDLGVPLVGLGLAYRKGYFDQHLRQDGWQEDGDDEVDPDRTPLERLRDDTGAERVVTVETFGRPVHVHAWTMQVGRVPVYLLDTDREDNHPDDRKLLSRLYAGGPDLRLRQEWILGVGGVRMLRAAGHDPAAWHANEGHAAFMMVERVRELVMAGVPRDEAISRVRRNSLFTTHTPVPAGHDVFDPGQAAACAGSALDDLGLDAEGFHALARHPTRDTGGFHMSVLALRLAGRVNGVSHRHGAVSRSLWTDLWPELSVEDVPIGHVTNGVHLATWMANDIMDLLDRNLGESWRTRLSPDECGDRIATLDPADLWAVHVALKNHLAGFVREEARRRFADRWRDAVQVVGAGTLLDPAAFTIGFARRFATYKRADLLFRDTERLQRLLVNPWRPVQLIISGKAHPEDTAGKDALRNVYRFTHDPAYEGRVAFLEDYEMHVAHVLVQGVDLWLNLPRVPMEACGTSGMKAALNGVPHLSTADGWWAEGADGTNGWTLPLVDTEDPEIGDAADLASLYRLLEEEVVPLYYDRDPRGIPLAWVDRMRNSIRVAVTRFTAQRMVRDYVTGSYLPAVTGQDPPGPPPVMAS